MSDNIIFGEAEFGIVICGANGCGKTTIGRFLSKELNFQHFDIEDYYFDKGNRPYSEPRSRDEVIKLIHNDIIINKRFIVSAVNCNFDDEVNALYQFGIVLYAPTPVRMERVKERSYNLFGEQMKAGGRFYEQEQEFFDYVEKESERKAERNISWLKKLPIPILQLDGTKKIQENIGIILNEIQKFNLKY